MSELDGISPRDLEAFEREYLDTHTEIKALSALEGLHKGAYNGGTSIKYSPGDKNAQSVKYYKKPIEKAEIEKQREKTLGCLFDAFVIRQKEILNKKDFSMKDLLGALTRLMPQQVDSKIEHDMTFADMVKSVHLERKHYKAIDAEEVDG